MGGYWLLSNFLKHLITILSGWGAAEVLRHTWYCFLFFWFKRVLDRGPEHRESKLTVLCLLIIIILISYIILLLNY
jgi:hypothetical protein